MRTTVALAAATRTPSAFLPRTALGLPRRPRPAATPSPAVLTTTPGSDRGLNRLLAAAAADPLASAEGDAVATVSALLSLDGEEGFDDPPAASSPARPSGLSESDLAALLGAGGSSNRQGFPVMLGLLGRALGGGGGSGPTPAPSSAAPTDAAAAAARRLLSKYDVDQSGDVSATELAQLVGDTFMTAADPVTARLDRRGLRALFQAAAAAAAGEDGALPPVGEGLVSDALARYGAPSPVAGGDGATATELTLTFRSFLELLRDEVVDLRALIRYAALGGGGSTPSAGAGEAAGAGAAGAGPPPAPPRNLAVAVGSLSSLERLLEEEEEEEAGAEATGGVLAVPCTAPSPPPALLARVAPGEVLTLRSLSDFEALLGSAGDALVCVQASLTFCRPCKKFRPAVAALAAATPGVVFAHFFGNANETTKVLFRDVLKVPLTPGFAFYRAGKKVGHIHTGANAGALVGALRERAARAGEDPLEGLPAGAEADLVARMKAGMTK
jgi:hypothetical protein